MKKEIVKVVIIGCGGNSRDVCEFIEDINEIEKKYEVVGFLDDNETGSNIIGDINSVHKFKRKCKFIFAIGSEKNYKFRHEIIRSIGLKQYDFISIIHPTAYISKSSKIGTGVIIYPNVTIHSNTVIDDFAWILSNTVVNHGSIIGENAIVCSGVNLLGDVKISSNTFIGSGTIINNYVKVGKYALVGSGSLVTKNIIDNTLNYGLPSRVKKCFDEIDN